MIALNRQIGRHDPLLLPDRDEPYCLHDVYEKIDLCCRDEVVLDLGDSCLRFRVNPDTDEIVSRFQHKPFVARNGFERIGSSSLWSRFLNKTCGWTWLAVNQQGYWDTVLISFDGIVPNVLLNAMASSLYIFDIGPMEKQAFDDSDAPVKTTGKKTQKKKRK